MAKKRRANYGMKALKKGDEEQKLEFATKRSRAIYTRARVNLGMSREQVLEFAESYLELKKPINSLKELSNSRLDKLYKRIFSIKK